MYVKHVVLSLTQRSSHEDGNFNTLVCAWFAFGDGGAWSWAQQLEEPDVSSLGPAEAFFLRLID